MDGNTQSDELFVKAFELAYFIHGDRETALKVAAASLAKLEVACAAQDKRLYYSPRGRTSARKARTKVNLSEPHLLQRLVYIESEPYEKQKEERHNPSEEDMVIHYIKHLVKITIKRNSFYVTLALSRLLHNYSTAETAEIYNLVVQDPERVRDDYYYRSRKGRLMKEIKERFANLINVAHGPRGEEKFESEEDSLRHAGAVRDCLDRFTPWSSPCVVPEGFDRFSDTIPHLAFEGDEPDEEHSIEANRLHSVLHPECYGRLAEALDIDPPEERLGVPQFHHSSNGKRPPSDRRHPPRLEEAELAAVQGFLAEQSARRRGASAGFMRIMVDDRECASLDIFEAGRARFEIQEGAEIIEVRASQKGEDILLASLLPDFEKIQNGAHTSSITLEGGQKLTFSLSPSKGDFDEFAGAFVDFTYRETRFRRAASLALRRFGRKVSERLRAGLGEPLWKPAFALLFLILLVASIFFLAQSGKDTPRSEEVVQAPTPPPEKEDRSNQPKSVQSTSPEPTEDERKAPEPETREPGRPRIAKSNTRPKAPQGKDRIAANPLPDERNPAQPDTVGDETRNTRPRTTGATLIEVKRVHVELLNASPLDQRIRELVMNALQASGRFTLIPKPNGADAVLKLAVARDAASGETTLIARLVNAAGFVLWPENTSGSGAKYTGREEVNAAAMVNDLIRAVEDATRKPARR
ncbi:MAG: hypothetical protein L0229_28805 [Blastocatellia bacterium]|nr:hypothetical protein [Blastocatellia bacterium]